ncbi:MAG: DUF2062 domain-containing protein, partial [Paracoccus sp. (in: a-proteobacteria)]|nr:DUF2062 domain-containing protein [Paracoccus sp. (in: a-proteobacteria)]
HRIARGVAAGVFVSFTPLFGFHFLSAAAVAWLIGGNVLAALLATFVGNPVTLPFIALASVGLGRRRLGLPGEPSAHLIFREFASATSELYHNIGAFFGPSNTQWDSLREFGQQIFLPYWVGGLILGLLVSVATHYLTVPIFKAYQRRREKKMADRIARAAEMATARMMAEQAAPTPILSPKTTPSDAPPNGASQDHGQTGPDDRG